MFKKILICLISALLIFMPVTATASELEGKVTSLSLNEKAKILLEEICWLSSEQKDFSLIENCGDDENIDNENILIKLIIIVPKIPRPKYMAFLLRLMFIFNKNAIITSE